MIVTLLRRQGNRKFFTSSVDQLIERKISLQISSACATVEKLTLAGFPTFQVDRYPTAIQKELIKFSENVLVT